ncbi:alpha/beta hydrolase family protein [Luteirhabdus pelagi]|uniref:alpha/beta hydrolase family protein n=1 Tax=Luteirhabdus pelagi TaxID=2792783 RepID=UPI001939AFB0|nr:alpha/beta fold hydrolase [Luteirhabdus pelagi]
MKLHLLLCVLFSSFLVLGQSGTTSEAISVTPLIDGTLLLPENKTSPPLAIIIAGSGPTNRDGNQMMMKNNSLKYLAEGLVAEGVASFRYDKRIVKIMKMGTLNEKKIQFDHFIEDAVTITDYFKSDDRFGKIYLIGHSQGSLIALVAAQDRADGVISIAGAGQEIDDVIVDQLKKQAPGLADNARTSFDDLRVNGVAQNYSEGLASIFRPAIQPFLLQWMQYNPQEEIAKLNVPVMIINGTKDLQVQESEAEALRKAKPGAEYLLVENMNHILKEIKGDDIENSKSYNDPRLPVMPEVISAISTFIKDQ